MNKLAKLSAALTVCTVPALPALAFPIATVGEGAAVIVGSTDPVIATYEGNSAGYTNDLYLVLDGSGNPFDDGDNSNDLFIFRNHTSPVGSTVNLGSFAIGTELIFRLNVTNTGDNFYTGLASRNPDNRFHARVDGAYGPGETLVSFEDLLNLPEYPGGFNDLSFSFTNTVAGPTGVPEPMTLSLLGAGLAGLAALRRSRTA